MNRSLFSVLSAFFLLPSAFAQQPVVSSVSPLLGNVGATVTVTGTGFNTTPGSNIVYFGATRASVTASDATSLIATVPPGATYQPVSVNNVASGLTGFSLMPFLPTYDNSAYDPTAIIFSPGVGFAAGTKPTNVALADFDGDGKTDMVVSDSAGGNGIIVYRNTSTSGAITAGSFEAGVAFATSQNTKDVIVGDVDGDGKPDIIVANSGSTLSYVTIFRNTTTSGSFTAASFAARVDFSANAGAQGVAMGDLDMDGRQDVVVTCSSNVVNIFRNLSTAGVFNAGSLGPKENFTPGTTPSMLAIADIDGDGKPDMAVVNAGSNNISVFRNVMTGPGPIVLGSTFAPIVNFTTGTTPHGIVMADIDGDGKQDMCITNAGSNFASVYRNTSVPGTSSFDARVDFTTGSAPYNLSAADINGDGKPDLIVSNNATNNVSVLRNTSVSGAITASSFAGVINIPAAASVTSANGVAVGDLDGDGKPDIAAVSSTSLLIFRNNPMAPITGTLNVCVGATTALSNTTGGGTWSSSATAIATVDAASGIVTGVAAGTATISYNITGATAIAVVTVSAVPDAGTISGTYTVCAGATTVLTDAVPGGVWSSTNTAIGTVGTSGLVSGIAAGTTTISYTVTTGCGTAVATVNVTVSPLPDAGTVSGPSMVCSVGTITLTSTVTGGTWSTADVTEASVDAATGEITGVAAGTATIVYTQTNTCGVSTVNYLVTVNALPDIAGTADVCVGGTQTLTSTVTTGTWTSTNTALATIGSSSGVVNGVSSGVVVVSYTDNGCSNTIVMTVNQIPLAGTLSGSTVFCFGTDITITSTMPGGVWSSSDVAIATVGTSGLVTGVDEGTAIISHTISNSCGTASATTIVTVEVMPNTGVITGPSSVCASGSTITLSNTVATGTWSSANTLAATIGTSGIVTGIDPGTSTISYTVSNTCGTQAGTVIVTVNPLPDAITGTFALCKDATTVLGSATSGGAWTSSGSAATVDASGVVSGVNAGTARISYTLVVGCFRTVVVTVNPLPPNIVGALGVCMGNTTTLANAVTGGTWVSANTAVANIGSSTGVVSTVAAGTAIITYTRPVTGCYTTKEVTVNPLPDPISGDFVICTGNTDTFSSSPAGGLWQSSNYFIAPVSSGSGIVTGGAAGVANINYTSAAGCKTWVTVTVNQAPSSISGPLAVCECSTSMLTNTLPFGVWVSSNTAVGVISGSGVVAGVAPGTSIVSYIMPTGCSRSVTVTINALPTSISGPSALCADASISLTGTPSGGTWSSSSLSTATVGSATGTVSGLAAGTSAVSYSLPTGCRIGRVITVNPTPTAITGALSVCAGGTTLLSSAPLTGSWISSNTSVATVGSTAGLVSGITTGTAVVSYRLFSSSCLKTVTVTVNPLPTAITGVSGLCVGATTTLTSTPAGGTWVSGSSSVATVDATSGVVTGIAGGTTTITYTTISGCKTSTIVTVNPLAWAGMLLGTPTVCEGATVSLTATAPGGTWSTITGNTSVDASGVVTGITGGADTIVYTVANGCNTAQTSFAMTVDALPEIGSISGGEDVCVGSSSVLTASVVGGSWSSSDISVVTVAGGIATGISTGSATISYTRSNLCGTAVATFNVIVVSAIDAGTISGPDTVCYANTVTLTGGVAGGTWFSNSLYVSVGATTGVITGLAPGLAVIRHVVSNGCSTDTAFFTIYVKYSLDCPTSIPSSVSNESGIRLYPVPTQGLLTLESPIAGTLAVFTVDGRELSRYLVDGRAFTFRLPTGIAPGMYMCRFTGNDGSTKVMRVVYEP